jgi:hypothetical protein
MLDLAWGKDREFQEVLTATVPIVAKHGVDLVCNYAIALGQYRKRVLIYEGPGYAALATAFDDPMLRTWQERANALGPATVEYATLFAGPGPRKADQQAKNGDVIITDIIQVRPGQVQKFLKNVLENDMPLMATYGVNLEAAYLVEIGKLNRVYDVWRTPTVDAYLKMLTDPTLDTQPIELDYAGVMESETLEIVTEGRLT